MAAQLSRSAEAPYPIGCHPTSAAQWVQYPPAIVSRAVVSLPQSPRQGFALGHLACGSRWQGHVSAQPRVYQARRSGVQRQGLPFMPMCGSLSFAGGLCKAREVSVASSIGSLIA
jgi:hypothetical protein